MTECVLTGCAREADVSTVDPPERWREWGSPALRGVVVGAAIGDAGSVQVGPQGRVTGGAPCGYEPSVMATALLVEGLEWDNASHAMALGGWRLEIAKWRPVGSVMWDHEQMGW